VHYRGKYYSSFCLDESEVTSYIHSGLLRLCDSPDSLLNKLLYFQLWLGWRNYYSSYALIIGSDAEAGWGYWYCCLFAGLALSYSSCSIDSSWDYSSLLTSSCSYQWSSLANHHERSLVMKSYPAHCTFVLNYFTDSGVDSVYSSSSVWPQLLFCWSFVYWSIHYWQSLDWWRLADLILWDALRSFHHPPGS
jgi:hypothetical protein